MINKNFYRKTNDKKILHKVGKEWKVVSVALLMAIAGGAVATHAVNADSTNDTDAEATNSLVSFLDQSATANAPRIAAPSSKATSSSAAKPAVSEGIHYYSGDNGSAASYFDKTQSDHAVADKYYNTVNAYVQSLNAEYNPEVSSFAAQSASAKSAASNDSKLAKSYSATTKNPNTVNTINSLANKNRMNPTIYQGLVQDNEQAYSGAVSSASNDVKANSDVASLTNKLESTDFSAANLSASTASVVARSNYNGALAIKNSIYAGRGYGSAGSYINYANELSADVQTLLAQGNPVTTNTQLGMLLNNNGLTDAGKASANSAFNSAVTTNVNSAKSVFASIASDAASGNDDPLSIYAASYGTHYDDNVIGTNPDDYALVSNVAINSAATNNQEGSEYFAAVSAATASQFAPVLASAANSLYSRYNPEYATYQTRSAEYSSAMSSASAAVLAASFAVDETFANSIAVASVSNDVGNNASAAAARYLHEGVSAFENNLTNVLASTDNFLGEDEPFQDNGINSGVTEYNYPSTIEINSWGDLDNDADANNLDNYIPAIYSKLAGSAKSLFKDHLDNSTALGAASKTPSDVKSQIGNDITDLTQEKDALNYIAQHGTKTGGSTPVTPTGVASPGWSINNSFIGHDNKGYYVNDHNWNNSNLINDLGSDATTNTTVNSILTDGKYVNSNNNKAYLSDIVSNINTTIGYLNTIANVAGNMTGEATNTMGIKTVAQPNNTVPNKEAHEIVRAALLSDGVDLAQLNAESAAINNVSAAASSASVSFSNENSNSAFDFNADLSVAASSANSALNSANTTSANYSAANDEDVTLASYFASSYTTDASNEANAQSSASVGLNDFFKGMTKDDATFINADDAYSSAEAAASNDYKLGVANAKSVYNRSAHFLDALKGARLHSTPNFGSKGDEIVGSVNKGDRLTVYGVNVSRNNNWRGVVRYYVLDNSNGKKGFFTGQDGFSKPAYLFATMNHASVDVKTLKPVRVYSDYASKKAIATIPAGKVIENADVVYGDDATQDAHGFTKVETASDDFFTANTDYVELVTPTVNNNTQSNYNFNLQNPNQKMGPYYNDASQD